MTTRQLYLINDSLGWGDNDDVRDIFQTETRVWKGIDELNFYQKIVEDPMTQIKLDKLNKISYIFTCMSWFAIISQYVLVTAIFILLLEDRQLNIYNANQILLRGILTIMIFFIVFNDIGSVKQVEFGLFRGIIPVKKQWAAATQIFVRYIGALYAIFMILIYVLTDPVGGGDTNLDRIQNFTSLVIVLQLDEIIIGQLIYNFYQPTDLVAHEDHVKAAEKKLEEDENHQQPAEGVTEYQRH